MYKFSQKSKTQLSTTHKLIQFIFKEVIKHIDCTILEGHRNEKDQNTAFKNGTSLVKFPNSKHNTYPSMAIDAIPYPIDWNDRVRLAYFSGLVIGISRVLLLGTGYKLISGIDWDDDNNIQEHKFLDFPHFELIKVDNNNTNTSNTD